MAKEFKIFMDCRLLFYAGVGRYQREILLNIFKEKDINVKFFILCEGERIKEFILSNGLPLENFYIINSNAKKYSFTEQFQLFHIFFSYRKKVDVFFSPHYNLPILYIPKNLVVTIHDLTYHHFPKYFGMLKTAAAKMVLKRTLKKAKKIITVSNFVKKDIIDMFGDISSDLINKIEVIYNGLSPNFCNMPNEDAKRAFKIKKHVDNYILYCGNRKRHKNIERLIKAFKIVKNEFKNLKFIIIGSKFKENDYLDEFIRKEQGDADIIQLQNISDEEIKLYYACASAFTLFSLSEGFGFAPLEASACGVPLILSRVGALPEIFGSAALFVDPYNINEMATQIRNVLVDESLRSNLKKRSLEISKKYLSMEMANKTFKCLKDTVGFTL